MERYSQKIIQALSPYGIPCVLNMQDKLVYAVLENSYGEIFCLYGYGNTSISGYAIYSLPVPKNKRQYILQYLSGIEYEPSGERFYLDRQTQCIAYLMDYPLERVKAQKGTHNPSKLLYGGLHKVYTPFWGIVYYDP